MKSILAAVLVLASMSFANAEEHGGAAAPAAAPAAQEMKKMNKKTARMECLKENASLKGRDLGKCVKSKLH